MSEDRLVGWLVFFRHQLSNRSVTVMPREVQTALIARRWMDLGEGDNAYITDAGLAITDLNAAEWGIDAPPKETEA